MQEPLVGPLDIAEDKHRGPLQGGRVEEVPNPLEHDVVETIGLQRVEVVWSVHDAQEHLGHGVDVALQRIDTQGLLDQRLDLL